MFKNQIIIGEDPLHGRYNRVNLFMKN